MAVFRVEYHNGAHWRLYAIYWNETLAEAVAFRLTRDDGVNVRIVPVEAPATAAVR